MSSAELRLHRSQTGGHLDAYIRRVACEVPLVPKRVRSRLLDHGELRGDSADHAEPGGVFQQRGDRTRSRAAVQVDTGNARWQRAHAVAKSTRTAVRAE